MLKRLLRSLGRGATKGGIVGGLVRGIGGGIVAGLGWKIASDVYDGIKKIGGKRSPSAEPAVEVQSEGPHAVHDPARK